VAGVAGVGATALCWSGVAPTQGSSLECNAPTTLTPFDHDGRIGAKWNAATATVAYGRTGANGYYHTFVSNADGSNERRVDWHAWRDDRHQFPAAWHPSGHYLVMTVEKNEHERSSMDATPGYVDGTNKRRLTFMNVRGNPQSVGRFRLAGSLSFTSNTSFFGDVMTRSLGLVGAILKVDCH
jgi:hypothetical protein